MLSRPLKTRMNLRQNLFKLPKSQSCNETQLEPQLLYQWSWQHVFIIHKLMYLTINTSYFSDAAITEPYFFTQSY